jgi:hypothetical protein
MPTLTEDRDAIRDLYARYCLYIDTGAADEWVATFTVDAEFLTSGDPVVGREALRAFALSIPSGTLHHMVLNEAIDVEGDSADYRSSVLVMSKGTIITTGRTQDRLGRVDGSWRIARRAFTPDAP